VIVGASTRTTPVSRKLAVSLAIGGGRARWPIRPDHLEAPTNSSSARRSYPDHLGFRFVASSRTGTIGNIKTLDQRPRKIQTSILFGGPPAIIPASASTRDQSLSTRFAT
jgi:hypothetical protein